MNSQYKQIEPTGRIVAFLTRDEIDFIDSLAKDALFSTGHKLSRTDIIRAMIDCIKINDINGKGVASRLGLEKKLLHLMDTALPGSLSPVQKKRRLNEND
jgi:hypothetical protein